MSKKPPAHDPLTEAVSNLAKPVYKDAAKPLAKQLGRAGGTVGSFVNTVLAPLALTAYAWELSEPKIKEVIAKKINEKLGDIQESKLVAPSQRILVPAVQSFVHATEEEDIADMFANLLASSMNVDKTTNVHPAFVQVINNLTADEAKVLKVFAKENPLPIVDVQLHFAAGGYKVILPNFSVIGGMGIFERPDLMPSYLTHLCQLGLLEIPSGGVTLNDESRYAPIGEHPEIQTLLTTLQNSGNTIELQNKVVSITAFGRQFISVTLNN